MWCPAGWMVTPLLVLSVKLQPVFQSSSEVVGVWVQSGSCSLQGSINGISMTKQPINRFFIVDKVM